jgi:hypothetical protein
MSGLLFLLVAFPDQFVNGLFNAELTVTQLTMVGLRLQDYVIDILWNAPKAVLFGLIVVWAHRK